MATALISGRNPTIFANTLKAFCSFVIIMLHIHTHYSINPHIKTKNSNQTIFWFDIIQRDGTNKQA